MEGKAPRMYARQYSPRQAYYSTSRSTENRCYEKKLGEDHRPAHEQLETQLKQLEHDRPAERACKIIDNEIATEYI